MDIPSVRLPTINIPGLRILSGFSFPPQLSNTTWFIIVFALGMFLASCMSNRCGEGFEDPINRFEHVHFEGGEYGQDCVAKLGLHDDRANPLDYSPYTYDEHGYDIHNGIVERFEDNGQDFPQPTYTSCSLKSNCLAGERDVNGYCIKEGCPSGMERGSGIGADFCYPTCAPGYEADGGARCYKTCQKGWITQGDKCVRPSHQYNKDTMPCRGCMPPTMPPPTIPIIEIGPGPVWMNPPYPQQSYVQTKITNSSRPTTATATITYPNTNPQFVFEYFNKSQSPSQTRHRVPDLRHFEPSQTNSVPIIEHMAQTETAAKASASPSSNTSTRKTWRVEDRIYVNELPCPLGYTQSGDVCLENCPPQYEDTGKTCVLHSYSVARPSYDRGSGIPFATKRSKYQSINPVQQCR